MAVVSVIALATPAMASCHGHKTDANHWTLGSWSISEWAEMADLYVQLKQIHPTLKVNSVTISAMVDQIECSGISHERAVQNMINIVKSMHEFAE
jgi:hypothetical protein